MRQAAGGSGMVLPCPRVPQPARPPNAMETIAPNWKLSTLDSHARIELSLISVSAQGRPSAARASAEHGLFAQPCAVRRQHAAPAAEAATAAGAINACRGPCAAPAVCVAAAQQAARFAAVRCSRAASRPPHAASQPLSRLVLRWAVRTLRRNVCVSATCWAAAGSGPTLLGCSRGILWLRRYSNASAVRPAAAAAPCSVHCAQHGSLLQQLGLRRPPVAPHTLCAVCVGCPGPAWC